MMQTIEQAAIEVIALYVLSHTQAAVLVTGFNRAGNQATLRVLRRLQLIDGPSAGDTTPLGRAVQRKLARDILNEPDHWIRKELYWPAARRQIEQVAGE